ncbi:holin [Alkalihalophilus pseudofirmus]|uniref:BhlA/UviB family holin-like peptide n=1 Tax=Alkalihalophilus pseudofirmus TaxID=79885 RepID=UPI000950C80E|nr:holin [Alkalihalophilus pseudofirmus]
MEFLGIPIEIVISNGLFAVLFIWLLKDTRDEAKKREDKLIEQIDKQNDAHERIVSAIERLEMKVEKLKEE